MAYIKISLAEYPWLFLLVFIFAILVGNLVITILLTYGVKLPRDTPTFPLKTQILYGITLTMGSIPVALMLLWVRVSASWWSMPPNT